VTTVANPFMDAGNDLKCFAPFLGTANLFREFPLGLCQCLLVTAEEARIIHELTVGQSQKRVQPRVKPDCLQRWGQWVIFLFHREADKPLGADAMNAARLDFAADGAVDFGLDLFLLAEQGQGYGTFTDLEPALRIAKRVVAVAFDAGKAWRFSCLNAAKEGTIGKVNADGDVL